MHYLYQNISPVLLLSTKIQFLVRTSTYTTYIVSVSTDYIGSFLPSVIRHSSNKTEFCQAQIESRDHEFLSLFPLYPSPPITGTFLSSLASVRVPFSGNLSSIQGSKRRASKVRVKLRTINNGVEQFMLTARNTRDVCSVGTRGLFGFHGRVGSRVKRILFLCHYVITPGGGCGGGREPTGVILAPWERIDAIFTRF